MSRGAMLNRFSVALTAEMITRVLQRRELARRRARRRRLAAAALVGAATVVAVYLRSGGDDA